MILVGFQRKIGEFNGIVYDNTILHLINDDDSSNMKMKNFHGYSCETLKVKTKSLLDMLSLRTLDEFDKFLNANVQLNFSISNNNAVLSSIKLLDSNKDFNFNE